MTEEEFQAQIAELNKKLEDEVSKRERAEIEKEAATSLLRNIDISGERKVSEGAVRDLTGHASMSTIIKDVNENTKSEVDEEIANATKEILGRFTDEQLGEPATIRSIISEYGKQVGGIAFKRATAKSIEVFQKAVDMKARIDSMINDWRTKNPELANKESEDLVEYILLRKVVNDPIHKGKSLPQLLDIATEMAKEQIERSEKKGEEKEKEKNNTIVPLTMNPKRSSESRNIPEKKEEPMTQEDSAARFLAMRKQMAEKKAWSGRPS